MNAATAAHAKDAAHPMRPQLRILVVDDDRDAVITLSAVLEDEGYEVRGAFGPEDALRLAEEFHPHVFILDIAMPGESGFSLAQRLRATRREFSRATYIAVTGEFTRPVDAMLSRAVGFDHHFVKPCDPSVILRVLQKLGPGGQDGDRG
jgi:DNA-binding response OmpR family regulator